MIMKKKITMIMFAILLMSASSLQAGIRIGVKGGVNLAKAALSTDVFQTDNFTGFQVGPIIEIAGISGLGVDAAVLYSQQGVKIKGASAFEFEDKVSTLDVPINLKLKFSLAEMAGIYLSAGPYASFKLDNQITFKQVKDEWTSKDFGVGVNFGAGIELVRHLQLGVNYQLGLSDNYNNLSLNANELKVKTRIWSLTATFFF
jgi:opacity protein-like surface antigen